MAQVSYTLVFCWTAWACIEQYLWTLSGNQPRVITVIWHYRKALHKWQHRSITVKTFPPCVGPLFSKYIINDFVCEVAYHILNGWIKIPRVYSSFHICAYITPILILLFYQFCLQLVRYIHIRNLSQYYHYIVAFIYDLNLWICIHVFFISMVFTL